MNRKKAAKSDRERLEKTTLWVKDMIEEYTSEELYYVADRLHRYSEWLKLMAYEREQAEYMGRLPRTKGETK